MLFLGRLRVIQERPEQSKHFQANAFTTVDPRTVPKRTECTDSVGGYEAGSEARVRADPREENESCAFF